MKDTKLNRLFYCLTWRRVSRLVWESWTKQRTNQQQQKKNKRREKRLTEVGCNHGPCVLSFPAFAAHFLTLPCSRGRPSKRSLRRRTRLFVVPQASNELAVVARLFTTALRSALHSKCFSGVSRHGNRVNRDCGGRAVAESHRHGTRSSVQYMFTEVAALLFFLPFFQKRASLLGNEKRQIDATFGTSDSGQSHERSRRRHHPYPPLPITKMASGGLPFRGHREKAATSSDWAGWKYVRFYTTCRLLFGHGDDDDDYDYYYFSSVGHC